MSINSKPQEFLLDYELCHFTSKLIGDEEDTLKFFIVFDITSHGPIFKVVVGSQIVVSQQFSCFREKLVLFYVYIALSISRLTLVMFFFFSII